jgi:hypothetical protein
VVRVGGIEGKVLVFNPTEKGVKIRKGYRVAEFHPGGRFTPARVSREYEVTESRNKTGVSREYELTESRNETGVSREYELAGKGGERVREDRSVRFPSCRPRVDLAYTERTTDFPFLPSSGLPMETQQPSSVALPERQEYVRTVLVSQDQEGVALGQGPFCFVIR